MFRVIYTLACSGRNLAWRTAVRLDRKSCDVHTRCFWVGTQIGWFGILGHLVFLQFFIAFQFSGTIRGGPRGVNFKILNENPQLVVHYVKGLWVRSDYQGRSYGLFNFSFFHVLPPIEEAPKMGNSYRLLVCASNRSH
jgi:hypothetical protein